MSDYIERQKLLKDIDTTAVDLAGWIASPTAKAIEQIASMIK